MRKNVENQDQNNVFGRNFAWTLSIHFCTLGSQKKKKY